MSGRCDKTILFALGFFVLSTLRPAHAIAPVLPVLLNPAVLGAVVVAGGVIAGTVTHYAPAVYEAGQSAFSSLGSFSRTLYQAEKFAASSGVIYVAGRLESLTLPMASATSSLYAWISGHPSDVPHLASGLTAATTSLYPSLAAGQVGSYSGQHKKILSFGAVTSIPFAWADPDTESYIMNLPNYGYQHFMGGYLSSAGAYVYNIVDLGIQPDHHHAISYDYCYMTTTDTSDDVTPPASVVFSPNTYGAYLGALPGATVAPEIDKLIAANPGAVTGVPPWSPADTDEGWRLAHSQSDDSRYPNVPPDSNHGKPGCTGGQGQ